MLKNKLIVKKIRNIVIFIMAIAILIGTYTYVRRSRAENVIQVELEISDKSETLEPQKITVDATETQDGNYLLDLPTAVNGNIVTKYYTTDGAEVVMNDENADKTLTLTQTEVDDLKVQLQTDYDKKEIETEDGQIITLYNKELLAEKKTEEETSEETITEEGETNQETKEQNSTNEITENETTENETTENETTENETTENELTESEVIENETTEGETTEEKVEFDDTVIVTGYMPLEAQVDIKEIDLSTLSEIQLPSDTQTMQKAYEVSVYQIVRRTFDVDGNLISEKTVMSQNLISDVANNEEEDTAVENETEGNEIAENEITENEITENENTNIQENSIIEDINAKNAKENENVESITEGTTPDNTTITTIMLKDGTRIEEEKMEYDPSIYNESIVIKTKNTEENTLATIYTIQEDNQIVAMESTVNKEYIHTTFSKDNQTVRYILAVEPNELPNEEIENDLPSNSGIETMAITDGNMLRSTSTETGGIGAFLGNTTIQRDKIDNVTFVDNIPEDVYDASTNTYINNKAWDVSAEEDNSIIAWYENNGNGSVKVYIGSNEKIYANTDSSYLFSYIGKSSYCTSTETITNLELLNTNNVTNMSHMFQFTGEKAMTSLELGDNFDTSNVTDMSYMFMGTGYNSMTSLDLGDKFDTSNVTLMNNMFAITGSFAMTSLQLGDKFDTRNVINMKEMFINTGNSKMIKLDLGAFFTNIADTNYNMFYNTGKYGEIVIQVPGEIYQDSMHFKLNANSSETIEFTNGTIILRNMLKSTSTEIEATSNFLGNTSIQRMIIENVTFMDHIPEDVYDDSTNTYINSTAWDVSLAQNGSIIAWYEVNGSPSMGNLIKVYIGSNEQIYANTDSSYLFSYIRRSGANVSIEPITNLNLLDTRYVTNMSHMFENISEINLDLKDNFVTSNVTNMSYMFANMKGANLNLGDNFDTSKVTDMSFMFAYMDLSAMRMLDLGEEFDTSKVTYMNNMFQSTGYSYMENLNLGDKFDTRNVTNMSNMFDQTGYQKMRNLDLGNKFNTSNVTNMDNMFFNTGYMLMQNLDLGPAFIHIAEENDNMFMNTGKTNIDTIEAPEAIYQDETNFKLSTDSSTTIEITRGRIDPLYRTEWLKESTQIDETDINNPKMNITLRGTTNTEVASNEYISDVTSSLTTNDIKVYIDDTEITDIVTKEVGTATQIANTRTGAQDVLQVVTLSNFEEAMRRTGKDYKEWSGNIRIEVAQGTLTDTTYGNSNMDIEINGSRTDSQIEDATKVDKNTTNAMFIDYIEPEFTYQYSSTDINHEEKTLTVDFSVTDKYFENSEVLANAENITVKMLDTNVVPENLTKTLRKVQDITETRDGTEVKIGEKYRFVISGFEKASIDNGKYKEYSGPVSIVFPAGMVSDKSGNTNVQKNITVGIDEPDGTGDEEIVDFIKPEIEKIDSSVNVKEKTATLKFVVTDKYLTNSTLTTSNIQVLVNGSVNTTIEKQLTSTVLNEQRVVDGVNSTAQYGTEYTLTLSEIDTTVNQIKVRIPEGTLLDTSGNGNKEKDFIVFNTLRSTSTETEANSGFLGNTNIERQNITNVTFVSNTSGANSTSWDVSAMGDHSIIAWYDTIAGYDTVKVYIGSNNDIFGNIDSSYLFSYVGYSENCKDVSTISLNELLNTCNVENMSHMFYATGTQSMQALRLGDNFDTSNVTDMSYMFYTAGQMVMQNLDLGSKFDTSKVVNMECMFAGMGGKIQYLSLSDKFDTSNVTNMKWMFANTGDQFLKELNLGDKFDTSNVTDMNYMFGYTGYNSMTSLDLGDKFNTSKVTDMGSMFMGTGGVSMTNLDLGPAFTNIAPMSSGIFSNTGKSESIVIQAPEAIYQDKTNFKLNGDSSTTIEFTRGTITPKYRTEWMKEGTEIDETDANNPKLNITLRGTTNTEIDSSEYISDVTSLLTPNDIKVYIDDTEITDVVTKEIGTATQTDNTRTGAKDILQVVTLSNFEEATRRTGKSYKEWSGNIRIEVAQGSLSDTTGPADEEGNKTTYGNKNMALAEDGSRLDNAIEDETKVDQNTEDVMFADFIKPEFTYIYSSTDINNNTKTLTVTFSVVDKFFNSTTGLTNADGITVKMIDENVVPENLTKTITKTRDITETRNNTSIKIGEEYTLTVTGFEQTQMAEDGKYKDYSGPVSIAFPAGIVSDKSGNTNIAKTITVGINEPDQSGTEEIVDFVKPTWKAENLQIDTENKEATVDLIGTDKYFESGSLDVSQIKVIVDGEEVTNTECVIKELSAPEVLNETRDGTSVQYGVKYTLTLSGWKQTDEAFQASEKRYREYSGNTQIIIEEGTLIDESGNESDETTLDLGFIDVVDPEVYQISVTKNVDEKTDTIIFDAVDKYFASSSITTTNTEGLTVYVDDEEAIGVTKTIVDIEDITATVNGSEKKIGERYTLVLSNFEQERTTPVDYDREYSDWSGTVTVKVAPGLVEDSSGNTNQEVPDVETISKDTEYVGYYADIDGNGSVDGVIYADLAQGKSGQWGTDSSYGTYSYATETVLKEYYISQTNYTGDFGTKDVITALEGSVGKERFYVMSLENFKDGNVLTYTWYDAACDKLMEDYATATSTDFGAGKTNTANMIAKWNASDYGPQDDSDTYKDMWGVIQEEVEKGWFVPSRAEWAAFGSNLNITKDDYADYNLYYFYWSSSQHDTTNAWLASFNSGYMSTNLVGGDLYSYGYVRLSATF